MPDDTVRPLSSPAGPLAIAVAERYRVERVLGAGGMATVYLAEDVRHRRKVAIKVLAPELSALLGPERFLREIELTASLQHPHILPLFDSGSAAGQLYYVMPYVDGETLRGRLERERQLPIADALRLATETADALEYAHARGVVHRDIKPENVLLQNGHALVADFGIALAVQEAGGQRITQTGLSLGTPQYMAPEQAMGERNVDARADVYALAAVTYEMLAGEPPFTGPTARAIVARAMTEAPRSLTTQRPSVPPHVDDAIRRALEPLPADRLPTAATFAAALVGSDPARWPPTRLSGGAASSRTPTAAARSRLVRGAGVAAVLVAAAAAGAVATWLLRPVDEAPHPVARALIPLPRGQLLSAGYSSLDLSRDGTQLVYVGDAGGRTNLFLRPLADSIAHVVPGTEGADEPFFSPDGAWIGFVANNRLVKVPRAGGPPIILADVPYVPLGVSWGDDGTILYALGDSMLYRVQSDGRAPPQQLRIATSGGVRALGGLRFPTFLPGGRAALVSTDSGVGVVDLEGGEVRTLFRGRQARYLPTGHLLYDDLEGRIRLVRFDLRARRAVGTPAPAFEAFRSSGDGTAFYAVSPTGTLVYMPGGFQRSLVWVDRNGREAPLALEPRGYRFPRVSPDGRLIAITIDPRPSSTWVIDPDRGSASVLTPAGTHAISPTWSPDGQRIAVSMRGTHWVLPIDGGAGAAPILEPAVVGRLGNMGLEVWTRGDQLLGIVTNVRSWRAPRDIVSFRLGDTLTRPLIATQADDRDPSVSPDGRWLAYASSTTGTLEVYVRPFAAPGPSVRVSTAGGQEPRWSRSGTELFYRSGMSIVAARVTTDAGFRVVGDREVLFSGPYDFTQDNNWDLAPDGRFLMVRGDPTLGTHVRVVFNWFDEVRALAPR